MKILIEVIPHISQRYNTIGDWQWFGDTLRIRVSDMGDWRKEFLVGIHEAIETMLCKHDGVTEEQVDAFDFAHPELHEPGDDKSAPYHEQHKTAIMIETLLMKELKVDETFYLEVMESLQNEREIIERKNQKE